MKIRRISAEDMRTAMRQVKDELGPEAVILSSNRSETGVELVAAVEVEDGDTAALAAAGTDAKGEAPRRGGAESRESSTSTDSFSNALGAAGAAATESGEADEGLTYGRPRPARSRSGGQKAAADRAPASEGHAGAGEPPAAGGPQESAAAPAPAAEPAGDGGAFRSAVLAAARDLESVFDEGAAPSEVGAELPTSTTPPPAELATVRDELASLKGLLEQDLAEHSGRAERGGDRVTALARAGEGVDPLTDFREDVGRRLRQASATYGGGTEGLRHGLAEVVRRPDRDVMAQGGVVALVGPTGVGKTTSVAKIAARYAMRHGYDQVALVTTDSYRIAAHEQLRTYARILGVPVRVANDAEELRTTLDNLADRSLVLIDTAGMSQRDRRLAEQFHTLVTGAPTVQTYAVLAANTQPGGLDETVHAFRGAELDGCVLTKIDESTSLGPALSTIIEQSLPLAFLSDGQRVPEDLHDVGPALLAERLTEIAALPEPALVQGGHG